MNERPDAQISPFHTLVLMRVERELTAPWIPGVSRLADCVQKINEHDRCALEIALRLKAEQGGRVTVIAWSPANNREALRFALAGGVERAIYLDAGNIEEIDGWALCRILAQAISIDHFDLILCGTQSQTALGGPLAALLAGLLDLPCVTRLVEGEIKDGTLYAQRSLESGLRETIRCPLPAIASVLPGEILPQYVSVHRRASVDMRCIEVRRITPPANVWILKELIQPRKRAQITPPPTQEGSASERMKRLLMGAKTESASGPVFEGSPQAAAERLYAYLQNHGFLPNRSKR
jgi:electron transfer flavoprotein beta subunit